MRLSRSRDDQGRDLNDFQQVFYAVRIESFDSSGMTEESVAAESLREILPHRNHAGSLLKAANNFWAASEGALARDVAEWFRARRDVPAVAVVDADSRVVGALLAERLFAMLGKPFGLEILGKSSVGELCDDVERVSVRDELFSTAAALMSGGDGNLWYALEEDDGRFAGLFCTQDLANYLSGITRDDVEYAGRLQERLIAGHRSVGGEGWAFEGWSRSAKGIGGDFYFADAQDGSDPFFSLCDISGKGVSASVLVSMAWGMLRMRDRSRGLDHLIRELNAAVVEAFHMEKYLTGVFMSWHPRSGRLTMADMGHSHIVFMRDGRPARPRSLKTNLPVGLETELEPTFNVIALGPGDTVFIHSDGLVEQENADGEEFGERRLRRVLAECLSCGVSPSSAIPRAFDEFRGTVPLQDDVSFIALRIV